MTAEDTSNEIIPGWRVYLARFLAALKLAIKPGVILKSIWRMVSRQFLLVVLVGAVVFVGAAVYHIYFQAQAGGWNDMPGNFIQPDNYDAGMRWFGFGMAVAGLYGLIRGMGFRVVRETVGALKVAPTGFGFAADSMRRHIMEPPVYERFLIVAGAAAVLGGVILRWDWRWRLTALLVLAAVFLLASLKRADEQRVSRGGRGGRGAGEMWQVFLAASVGFLVSYMGWANIGAIGLGGGVVLRWVRMHPTGEGGTPGGGGAAGMVVFLLSATTLLFSVVAAHADDGGWDEFNPSGKKTIIGYLQTPDGQKVVFLGGVAGGFAAAGGWLGLLFGGGIGVALHDAFKEVSGEIPESEESYEDDTEDLDDLSDEEYKKKVKELRAKRDAARAQYQAEQKKLLKDLDESVEKADRSIRDAKKHAIKSDAMRDALKYREEAAAIYGDIAAAARAGELGWKGIQFACDRSVDFLSTITGEPGKWVKRVYTFSKTAAGKDSFSEGMKFGIYEVGMGELLDKVPDAAEKLGLKNGIPFFQGYDGGDIHDFSGGEILKFIKTTSQAPYVKTMVSKGLWNTNQGFWQGLTKWGIEETVKGRTPGEIAKDLIP